MSFPYDYKGEKHKNSKLTEAQVIYICEKYAMGEASQADLAAEFNISRTLVTHLVNGSAWHHVPRPLKGRDYTRPGDWVKLQEASHGTDTTA